MAIIDLFINVVLNVGKPFVLFLDIDPPMADTDSPWLPRPPAVINLGIGAEEPYSRRQPGNNGCDGLGASVKVSAVACERIPEGAERRERSSDSRSLRTQDRLHKSLLFLPPPTHPPIS